MLQEDMFPLKVLEYRTLQSLKGYVLVKSMIPNVCNAGRRWASEDLIVMGGQKRTMQ